MILSPLVRGRDFGTLCCGGMILLPFGVRGKMLVPFDVGDDAVALWNVGGGCRCSLMCVCEGMLLLYLAFTPNISFKT